MKPYKLLLPGILLFAPAARAVYAPVPEQQLDDAWTIEVKGGMTSDSNIFADRTSKIDSTVYTLSPKVSANLSLTNQTFFSSYYQLTIDHFSNRPTDKTLDSHQLMARVAHQFSQATTIDFTETFTVQHNPQSLLAGQPINSDQSFKNNEVNLVYTTGLSPRADLTVKGRTGLFRYDNAKLSANLDRAENIYGFSAGYKVVPELKLDGEFRYQWINYSTGGATKDKSSTFFLVGADYAIGETVTATARAGYEDRRRKGAPGTNAPYFELTGNYDYAEGSYLSTGVVYTYEEASNVTLFTDTQSMKFFANIQHALTPLITASAALNYEPSQLKGRVGTANVDDRTWRLGLALSYVPNKNFTVSATYDRDDVSSDEPDREFLRNRFGIAGVFTY